MQDWWVRLAVAYGQAWVLARMGKTRCYVPYEIERRGETMAFTCG